MTDGLAERWRVSVDQNVGQEYGTRLLVAPEKSLDASS